MSRYYFDTRNGSDHVRDDQGFELSDFTAARKLAERSLIELARDDSLGSAKRTFSVDVRDHLSRTLLTTELVMETRVLSPDLAEVRVSSA